MIRPMNGFFSLAVAVALLSACQSTPSHHDVAQNQFDQQFLDQMSQHHAGAIAMARLAERQGSTEHVKGMATKLISKQGEELKRLQAWRTQWYGPGPAPAPGDKDRQMTEELSRLNGVAFDKGFITKMIEHHQEGIKMATPATHDAVHPEVRAFAKQMINDQTHEIEHLQGHLRE